MLSKAWHSGNNQKRGKLPGSPTFQNKLCNILPFQRQDHLTKSRSHFNYKCVLSLLFICAIDFGFGLLIAPKPSSEVMPPAQFCLQLRLLTFP